MLVDFDDVFVDHALQHKYVTEEQVAEARRLQKKEADAGRRYYLGQVLIRKRFLSCGDFLSIENALGHKLYECAQCKARYGVGDLGAGGTVACKGCGAEVRIDGAGLSIVEILASKDPRDLTISLCPTNGAPPAPTPVGVSSRIPVSTRSPAAPPGESTRQKTKSKLNRAVLELSKEELTGLARYEVLEELGRGGMGIVFKARQVDIDRVCALKVIKAGPNVPEVQINRFVQEARAAAQLNHPNIVTIYDFGRYRDMFYIAMEFIPGAALAKVIYDEETRLTIDRAIEIVTDILEAVSYAHEKGVIHRDLKPQNILVETERQRARLIDFGLAKDHSMALGLTQTGQILGSPFYLSPEQTRGESRNVDPRSDVFALGVILYEMVTRTRPFSGRSAAEVYAKILKERPAPPSAIEPDVDTTLQGIILKALEKAPEDRFQTAGDFAKALRDYVATRPERGESRAVSAEPQAPKTKSGRQRALTGRQEKTSTTTRALKRTSSDRAPPTLVRSRVSGSMPTAADPDAGSGSKLAVILVAALALGAAVLVAAQGGPRPPEHPGPVVGPVVPIGPVATSTPTNPDSPDGPLVVGPPRDEETIAVRELDAFERSSPTDWTELLNRWKDLHDRFPRQRERARDRLSSLERAATKEQQELLAKADDLLSRVAQLGEVSRVLEGAIPRFDGTRWAPPLKERAASAVDKAKSLAQTACAESERRLAAKDAVGAMAAVTSFTKTGVSEADELLKAQRKKVREAVKAAEDETAKAREKELEAAVARIESVKGRLKERAFAAALTAIDEALKAPLEEDDAKAVQALRAEVALLHSVLDGAGHADVAAAVTAKKDVVIEAGKGVKGPAVRVKDGFVSVKVPGGGGEADYEIVKLPARTVARLFELSKGYAAPEAPLAKALFYLLEGEAGLARTSLEEAKRRGVDVTAYEGRFGSIDEPTRPGTQPGPATGAKPDDEKPVKDDGVVVPVPAGTFTMGNRKFVYSDNDPDRTNEFPDHAVTLDAYGIDKYEVTNHQYARFLKWLGENKTKAHKLCHENEPRDKDHTPAQWGSQIFGGDAHPVVGVDWYDAYAFARWSKKRLPTEAEWERAARGTDGRAYPWGNAWDPKRCVSPEFWVKTDTRFDDGWTRFTEWLKTAARVTMPVDSLDDGKSPVGAYNMAGNVAEWCLDWYDPEYYTRCYEHPPTKNPQGPDSGTARVVRGGMWGDRTPAFFLAAGRSAASPLTRVRFIGFRCVRGADERPPR